MITGVASAGLDHPRSRGVYLTRSCATSITPGSSPLARGLLVQRLIIAVIHGIIPARAGFTLELLEKVRAAVDHPRSRGVYQLR